MNQTIKNDATSSCKKMIRLAAFFISALLIVPACFSDTVILAPNRDNTLYESMTGTESNGAGDSLFAGRTGVNNNGQIRRGTISFDVASSVPANVTITGVTLSLFLTQAGSSASGKSVSVSALTSSWGEGASVGISGQGGSAMTGDATWLHRFFNTLFWNTPGGDFDAQPSATTTIGFAFQRYSWSSPGLIDDVQSWVANPASNFGWIIRGDETATNTALRFSSRETTTAANRPELSINYLVVPEPSSAALLIAALLPSICAARPWRPGA